MKISQLKFYKMKFLITILLFFTCSQSFANAVFTVNNQDIVKTKILFIGFDQYDPYLRSPSFDILERLRNNLKNTDLFEVIKQSAPPPRHAADPSVGGKVEYPQVEIDGVPDFAKYAKAGIDAVVMAKFNRDGVGNIEIRVRAYDILDQRQLFGKIYTASKDSYRKVANAISNEIFKAITGEKIGHFDSQIVYVAETGAIKNRIKRIARIDFDGENHRYLTSGRDLVLSPVFSKKRDEIFYVRYFQNRPQIFSLNLQNLRSDKVGGFRITNFAPAPHPQNPDLLLLSAIQDGNSDIYEINIAQNTARRLTKDDGIDTTASYSPDGKYIAFASNRAVGQKLYLLTVDGYSLRRLSSGSGTYSKPMWSPDGKLIAFTKIENGQFYIGVMLADGSSERLLASGYLVEGAKFSPNSRYLVFSKKKGSWGKDSIPRLSIIDILTGHEFELPTPEDEGAIDPDWASN